MTKRSIGCAILWADNPSWELKKNEKKAVSIGRCVRDKNTRSFLDEIRDVVAWSRSGKTHGVRIINAELLTVILDGLHAVLKAVWQSSTIPHCWRRGYRSITGKEKGAVVTTKNPTVLPYSNYQARFPNAVVVAFMGVYNQLLRLERPEQSVFYWWGDNWPYPSGLCNVELSTWDLLGNCCNSCWSH